MNAAVIGLGYGDEGKGLISSYLCSRNDYSMVARFSGGPQASHKVMVGGKEHVFSNFGSGTLQGFPTYWMHHCPVDPLSLIPEADILLEDKKVAPYIYIHKDCPVITPYDMDANRTDLNHRNNGTCGRGIGKTIEREEKKYSLTFGDLYNETILQIKLGLIQKVYYQQEVHKYHQLFLDRCKAIVNCGYFFKTSHLDVAATVFEGSQGLLLDQDIGFFPYVTRGNTGTKNIAQYNPAIYLVTRAYQSRHGNGPLTNTEIPHSIKLSQYEHNITNDYQGDFRVSVLDLDILRYAIEKDAYINKSRKNIAITCLDNISDYKLTMNGQLCTYSTEAEFVDAICKFLRIDGKVLLSRTPFTEKVEEVKK